MPVTHAGAPVTLAGAPLLLVFALGTPAVAAGPVTVGGANVTQSGQPVLILPVEANNARIEHARPGHQDDL